MYKINSKFITQKMANGFLIFDPESSTTHSINESGSFILAKLKKGLTDEKICHLMEERYKLSSDQVNIDFKEFIQELIKLNIISSGR